MFESGLNWAISTTVHQYLIIHAAAVERGGRAMIIPGQSGSGKSTLCAGLAFRGWRLLSDELALIAPLTTELVALARPINLKNESIEVVRRLAPGLVLSSPAKDTLKGTIVLVRPPTDSIDRIEERAAPRWIVFPSFENGAPTTLTARPRAESFIELAANAINYGVLGERGFNTLAEVITRSSCFELTYSDLDEGVRVLTEMSDAT
jgi:HprK-related kinase A